MIATTRYLLQECIGDYVWGDWGPCSLSCGTGIRERRRICFDGSDDLSFCERFSPQEEVCNEQVNTEKLLVFYAFSKYTCFR